jgi:dihydroneopterin aldolase
MPDRVFVRSLIVRAIIGIHPHERVTPQPVRISFEMETDIRAAARTDHISDALDYSRAADLVAALTRDGRFFLIETLAERIAERLLAEFRCDQVWVEVEKTEALADAASVGISIERHRVDL